MFIVIEKKADGQAQAHLCPTAIAATRVIYNLPDGSGVRVYKGESFDPRMLADSLVTEVGTDPVPGTFPVKAEADTATPPPPQETECTCGDPMCCFNPTAPVTHIIVFSADDDGAQEWYYARGAGDLQQIIYNVKGRRPEVRFTVNPFNPLTVEELVEVIDG